MRPALTDPTRPADRGFPTPDNEIGRVSSLRLLRLVGTEPEPWWQWATGLAAQICGTPHAVVNLIDATQQFSLAPHGYTAVPVSRAASMCATSIMDTSPSFTEDATQDGRWSSNPFVTGEIDRVCGYFAAPLTLTNGHTIGTICAFSRSVTDLTPAQVSAMNDLAAMTVHTLELRARVEHLSLAATRDPLTQLPNRALMDETLGQALARFNRGEANVAVVFLDLDGFKSINDQFGHAVGDELLKAVAGRLVNCVRATDVVTRPGGDEFVIVCTSAIDDTTSWSVDRVATAITDVFHEPFELSIGPIDARGSIGVAYPEDGDTPSTLMHRADIEMYSRKPHNSRTE
jgi:diguanylate cyclase (GGDEF)-like protein